MKLCTEYIEGYILLKKILTLESPIQKSKIYLLTEDIINPYIHLYMQKAKHYIAVVGAEENDSILSKATKQSIHL